MKTMTDNYRNPNILKGVIVGLLLVPTNCYWVFTIEATAQWCFPTYLAPFYNTVFSLLILVALNLLLQRYLPRFALNGGELLIVYAMINIGSALASHNMMQVLVPILGHAFWFATPENDWKDLFWDDLPRWLLVDDKEALTGYYEGNSTLYTIEHLRVWLSAIIPWLLFILALLFVMLCINVIIKKQWTERERLTYPIIQLPVAMITEPTKLFLNRLMWVGFAIAAFVNLMNGLHTLYPIVPALPVKHHDMGHLFTNKPWNAIGTLAFYFYPHVIGLGFLIPLDLSISIWAFYLFQKVQLVIASATGTSMWLGQDFREQTTGAYIGLCVIALWMGRRHYWQVLSRIKKNEKLDDSTEPIRYRTAVLGICFGLLFLSFFSYKAGMSLWLAPLFFLLYYVFAITVTRLRAELGYPLHDVHFARGPDHILLTIFGTRVLRPHNLTVIALYHWFNRTYASHPMPHQLEAFKLSERLGISGGKFDRKLFWIMVLATGFGVITNFWIFLRAYYKFGASSGHFSYWAAGTFGQETFNILQNGLYQSTQTDYRAIGFMGVGFAFTLFLIFLKTRLLWWPFHPLGYAISQSWGIHLWSCFLFASIAKWLILKYGGLKEHRRALPFFFGLILGDFALGSFWNIVELIFRIPTYHFGIGD